MSLRGRIEAIVEGMPDDARVSLSVSWLRRMLDEEPAARNPDGILTLEEVAERVGRSVSTIRTWCNTGDLDGFKLNGRDWRIRESALKHYLKEQEKPAAGQRTPTTRGEDADLGKWRRHFGGDEGAG